MYFDGDTTPKQNCWFAWLRHGDNNNVVLRLFVTILALFMPPQSLYFHVSFSVPLPFFDTSCKTPKWPQSKWYTKKIPFSGTVFRTLSLSVLFFVASDSCFSCLPFCLRSLGPFERCALRISRPIQSGKTKANECGESHIVCPLSIGVRGVFLQGG